MMTKIRRTLTLYRIKGDVKKSNDEHIDQDFPGFPGHPAKENIINPKTDEDRTVAGIGEDDEDD